MFPTGLRWEDDWGGKNQPRPEQLVGVFKMFDSGEQQLKIFFSTFKTLVLAVCFLFFI
jgi:hypothetical protein